MNNCIDLSIGKLLSAYEINTLAENDGKRFEEHLLACDHCFDQMKEFSDCADILRKSETIREMVSDLPVESPKARSRIEKLRSLLWPDTPFIFKPAVIYSLVLVALLASSKFSEVFRETGIDVAQYNNLLPKRSGGETTFRSGLGDHALLTFFYRDAVIGESYNLTIEFMDGDIVFEDSNFSGFDQFHTGALHFNLERMKPGRYHLIISENTGGSLNDSEGYYFDIE